jgi:hypothetical protein
MRPHILSFQSTVCQDKKNQKNLVVSLSYLPIKNGPYQFFVLRFLQYGTAECKYISRSQSKILSGRDDRPFLETVKHIAIETMLS